MAEEKNGRPGACFEDALGKLEMIVKELETGELPLEESLGKFEEGIKLSRFCFRCLEEAEQLVDRLVKEENGEVTVQPLPKGGEV